MGRYSKKPTQNKRRAGRRGLKLKSRVKNLDEIHELVNNPDKMKKFQDELKECAKDPDCDLPGRGQFPCITCAKFFQDERTLGEHVKSKRHKQRLKELEDEPYTIEEAEAAGGLGKYKTPDLKRIKTNVASSYQMDAQ